MSYENRSPSTCKALEEGECQKEGCQFWGPPPGNPSGEKGAPLTAAFCRRPLPNTCVCTCTHTAYARMTCSRMCAIIPSSIYKRKGTIHSCIRSCTTPTHLPIHYLSLPRPPAQDMPELQGVFEFAVSAADAGASKPDRRPLHLRFPHCFPRASYEGCKRRSVFCEGGYLLSRILCEVLTGTSNARKRRLEHT